MEPIMEPTEKPFLVSSLEHVNLFLQNIPFNTPPCFYGYRYAIQKELLYFGDLTDTDQEQEEYHSMRIWRTKSLFDWWVEEQSNRTFIGALDYVINDDHIKCKYFSINDITELGYGFYVSDITLTDEEISKLSKSFISHLKIVAQKENKAKIIVDVHNNLRFFEKHFEYEGFRITKRKSPSCHPFYVEAELLLQQDYCVK